LYPVQCDHVLCPVQCDRVLYPVQCDRVLYPVQFLCCQKMTDFKEQCMWQNWCRNLSGVNICFQRGSSEADCSIWLFCRVQKWNDICQVCWIFRVPV